MLIHVAFLQATAAGDAVHQLVVDAGIDGGRIRHLGEGQVGIIEKSGRAAVSVADDLGGGAVQSTVVTPGRTASTAACKARALIRPAWRMISISAADLIVMPTIPLYGTWNRLKSTSRAVDSSGLAARADSTVWRNALSSARSRSSSPGGRMARRLHISLAKARPTPRALSMSSWAGHAASGRPWSNTWWTTSCAGRSPASGSGAPWVAPDGDPGSAGSRIWTTLSTFGTAGL